MTFASRRRPARLAALASVVVTASALSGCAQAADIFNDLQSIGAPATPTVTPSPAPAESVPFDSMFTRDGSVSLTGEVADGLELRVDVWAADPKRTMEWRPSGPKTFGMAVNVYDLRVDDKSVLSQKRRVFISQLTITSATSQSSAETSSPFQFGADPRTLVPSDTLRSERGLLLNSFQGGLLVPEMVIQDLPADTFGITLQFTLTVAVESAADGGSFEQQTVYHQLPIAIHPVEG